MPSDENRNVDQVNTRCGGFAICEVATLRVSLWNAEVESESTTQLNLQRSSISTRRSKQRLAEIQESTSLLCHSGHGLRHAISRGLRGLRVQHQPKHQRPPQDRPGLLPFPLQVRGGQSAWSCRWAGRPPHIKRGKCCDLSSPLSSIARQGQQQWQRRPRRGCCDEPSALNGCETLRRSALSTPDLRPCKKAQARPRSLRAKLA